jgi:excisionase family DNA binding protein
VADRVVIPLPGIGTLALSREVFEEALAAGRDLIAAPSASPAPSNEPLVDADQLAAELGVPVTWLEAAARQGRIPSIEFGRWRRFRRSEVEAAVRSERSESEGKRA